MPSELLDKPLLELLSLIASGKLAKEALEGAKKRVKELWDKREYGFTIEPELASDLQRISKSEAYSRLKDCIGNHPFLSLVKLGLRVEELSERGDIEKIAKIKNSVFQKHGLKGIRIIDMGSAGVLIEVIRYLSDVKIKHNYTQVAMASFFENMIDKWVEITVFHKSDHGQSALENKIKASMEIQRELFFVFASGSASDQAKRAIASLRNDDVIRRMGYMFSIPSRKEDMMGRGLYTWIFEKIVK